MITRVNSKIRYYREVIQGVSGQATTHSRIRMRKGPDYIDISTSVVTSTVTPTSGTLSNLVGAGGEVNFGVDKLVTVNVDLRTIREVDAIEVKHATSGTFRKVLIQASTDGVKWYTLYDSTLDGNYAETINGNLLNVYYETDNDARSGIIMNVEDFAPFDPKQMIWDNDKKLLDYFEGLISKCQHYKLASSTTATSVVLENDLGLYPTNLFDNMMVYWIQTSTADTVSSVTLKVGNLVAKPLVVEGSDTITLNAGDPYIAIYQIGTGKFKLLSGGGSGLASKIATVQSTSGFVKFELGAFDKATGQFKSPNISIQDPILAEAILIPRSFGFEGYLSGMLEITGMLDVDGNPVESGEVYFVSQSNPKKVTKVQPEGGWIQPFLQTYTSKGKLYGLIMDTDTFYADSFMAPTLGRGLDAVDGVMQVDAVDGSVNSRTPSFNKMITEKDLVGYGQRVVGTKSDVALLRNCKVGEVIKVLGDKTYNDGLGFECFVSSTNVAGAIAMADGTYAVRIEDNQLDSVWGGNYGGKIQDPIAKEVGKRYIDNVTGKAYYCIKAGDASVITNTTEYFTPCNVVDNLSKINNLISVSTIGSWRVIRYPDGYKEFTTSTRQVKNDKDNIAFPENFTDLDSINIQLTEITSNEGAYTSVGIVGVGDVGLDKFSIRLHRPGGSATQSPELMMIRAFGK